MYGDKHFVTLHARTEYAHCLVDLHRYDEALAAWAALLDDSREVNGPESEKTLSVWNHYAWTLFHAGRVSEAEVEYEFLIEETVRILGADHPFTKNFREVAQRVATHLDKK